MRQSHRAEFAAYHKQAACDEFNRFFVEFSGIPAEAEGGHAPTRYFSCGQWSNDRREGLSVNCTSGRVQIGACNVPLKVSCRRPGPRGR